MNEHTPSDPATGPDAARRAVLATGPALRDVDAAVTCVCSCHPRGAEVSLHDGGATCACQRTPEERRGAFAELLRLSEEFGLAEAFEEERAAFGALAEELGTPDARIRVSACPLVVTGRVDGQAFYFRERHGSYRVEIPADGADVDLYDHHAHAAVAIGAGDATFTPAEALQLSAQLVRAYLRVQACEHRDARAFCPDCGTATATAS